MAMTRDEMTGVLQALGMLASTATELKAIDTARDLQIRQMEMRETEAARNALLREYYDKKGQVAETEKMFDKYRAADPDYKSSDGMDLINIVDKQNKIDMSAVAKNLNRLSTYQTDLQRSLVELGGQSQKLKELQREFWGAEKVLQEVEYEEFQEFATTPKTEMFELPSGEEVPGLGWDTTAGADVAFYKMEPSVREDMAYRMSERYTKEAKIGAAGSYAVLQAIFTPGPNEDIDDLITRLTYTDPAGNKIEPSKEIISVIQSMAGQNVTYDDFLVNLNAYPAGSGGDLIRTELASNPNTAQLFSNLKRDADLIRTLDNELAGINEPGQVTDFDNFVSNISGLTSKEAIFGLYDQAITGKDPALHDKFFNAVEAQLGGIDAGEAYMTYKGFYDSPPPPPDKDELETDIESLTRKHNILWEAGFYGTPEYQNISDSLKTLNREFRERESYRIYTERMEERLLQGVLSEEELSELSSLVNISVEDLKRMVEEKHQQKMLRGQSTRRPFYEAGLME